MAELIGVLSGILTVAELGFEIYKALSQTARELGSAGNEILLFSSEVRIFAEILVLLRSTLLNQPSRSCDSLNFQKAVGIVPGVLEQCQLVYSCMIDVLEEYRPQISQKAKLRTRLRWSHNGKVKMVELRGFLEPLKSSLHLLVTIIKNEVADKKQEPAIIRSILREELRTALSISKTLTVDPQHEIENPDSPGSQELIIRSDPFQSILTTAESMVAKYDANPEPSCETRQEEDISQHGPGWLYRLLHLARYQTSQEAMRRFAEWNETFTTASIATTRESRASQSESISATGWAAEEPRDTPHSPDFDTLAGSSPGASPSSRLSEATPDLTGDDRGHTFLEDDLGRLNSDNIARMRRVEDWIAEMQGSTPDYEFLGERISSL